MKLKNMLFTSLFVAVIAVLGILPPITLPISPVPITAQTLGVMLAGAILGARYGGLSIFLFVLLVAFGAPLLSGGRGGIGPLLGPGGGYILSWPIGAFVIGLFVEKYWHKMNVGWFFIFNVIGGIILVYIFGITYLSIITSTPWIAAAISGLVFLPGDFIKAIIAAIVANQIRKAYPIIHRPEKQSA